ncbi:unnamed protein product, partial [Brassica rapa subsp. trilocularis]
PKDPTGGYPSRRGMGCRRRSRRHLGRPSKPIRLLLTCLIMPIPSDKSSQISISQQDVEGEIDSSDDGMPP